MQTITCVSWACAELGAKTSSDAFVRRKKIINHQVVRERSTTQGDKSLSTDNPTLAQGATFC